MTCFLFTQLHRNMIEVSSLLVTKKWYFIRQNSKRKKTSTKTPLMSSFVVQKYQFCLVCWQARQSLDVVLVCSFCWGIFWMFAKLQWLVFVCLEIFKIISSEYFISQKYPNWKIINCDSEIVVLQVTFISSMVWSVFVVLSLIIYICLSI